MKLTVILQTGVVKEPLRVGAVVSQRLPLTSPSQRLRYEGWDIPPKVSAHHDRAHVTKGRQWPALD